jgi:mono/diheme cytochrome c family protein
MYVSDRRATTTYRVLMLSFLLAGFAGYRNTGHAQQPTRNVWTGVYTPAQTERAAKAFKERCASCHGDELRGGVGAPSLRGPEFQFSWDKKSVGELFAYLKMNMPPGATGEVTDQQYADIIALVLKANGVPEGSTELLPTKADLDSLVITASKP